MESVLEEVATEFAGRIIVGKLNVDKSPMIAQQFCIEAIPTFFIFKDGEVVSRLIGVQSKDRLVRMIGADAFGEPDGLVVLFSIANEQQGIQILERLTMCGIEPESIEVVGSRKVTVRVLPSDLESGMRTLLRIQHEIPEIDWSNVTFGSK